MWGDIFYERGLTQNFSSDVIETHQISNLGNNAEPRGLIGQTWNLSITIRGILLSSALVSRARCNTTNVNGENNLAQDVLEEASILLDNCCDSSWIVNNVGMFHSSFSDLL
eukprot:g10787.t1